MKKVLKIVLIGAAMSQLTACSKTVQWEEDENRTPVPTGWTELEWISDRDRTILGDLAPKDFDLASAGVQTRLNDLDNVIVNTNQPQPTASTRCTTARHGGIQGRTLGLSRRHDTTPVSSDREVISSCNWKMWNSLKSGSLYSVFNRTSRMRKTRCRFKTPVSHRFSAGPAYEAEPCKA